MEKTISTNRVAVVILNWNGRSMMERFLAGVIKYSEPAGQVIVADNASTDDSLAFLRENFPELPLIVLDRNYGFAEGYNRALKQIEAPYYLLLNSDVEVTEGWLEPLVGYMNQHSEVAACQPKLLSYFNKGYFEYAGASGGYIDYLGYPFCRGRILDMVEADKGQYDTETDIFWATGAAMMIRSKDYWEAGGLDGDFFAHMEEIDLCWRLHLLGRKLTCIPASRVYHWGGGTLPKGNPRKTYLNFRNNLLMLYKNLPEKDLRRVLFLRMLMDGMAGVQFLLQGKWGDFKAVLQAHHDYRAMKPAYRKKRTRIQQQKRNQAHVPMLRRSLIFQYMFLRKKTFSRLIQGGNDFF